MFLIALFILGLSATTKVAVPMQELPTINQFTVATGDIVQLTFSHQLGFITLYPADKSYINVGTCADTDCSSVSSWYYYQFPRGVVALGTGASAFNVEIVAVENSTVTVIAGYMSETGACSIMTVDAAATLDSSEQVDAGASYCWIDPTASSYIVTGVTAVPASSDVRVLYSDGGSGVFNAGEQVVTDSQPAVVRLYNSGAASISSPVAISSSVSLFSYGTMTYKTNAIVSLLPNLIRAPYYYIMSTGRCTATSCGSSSGGDDDGKPGGSGLGSYMAIIIVGVVVVVLGLNLIPLFIRCYRQKKSRVENGSTSSSSSSSGGHRRISEQGVYTDEPTHGAQYYSAVSNERPWYEDTYAPPPPVIPEPTPDYATPPYPPPQMYDPQEADVGGAKAPELQPSDQADEQPAANPYASPRINPYASGYGDPNLYP